LDKEQRTLAKHCTAAHRVSTHKDGKVNQVLAENSPHHDFSLVRIFEEGDSLKSFLLEATATHREVNRGGDG
jgi:hypothetical protein